ncbi:non-oxidative hydroxyarylic acid decarboxylases subunit D [Brenneria goodwinii]|uniref:non-oxidative hydroxyarylic acid decarboxylases subunit D n=1 Tax=Brenneria goodwinii TaxID=1109412 RepID=UPI000EF21BAF|nr:non-oxidative hydroxyarylic acid decarboxylases subunit D [Brenneria goodwinii]RLM18100.1 hypothetical protein BIY28_19315 [Brenneria goodwinii]
MSTENIAKICPRCRHHQLGSLYDSPVAGVWKVLQCSKCLYIWRTSEPARRSDPAHYPEEFRLSDEKISHVEDIPAIPPLKNSEA